MVRLFALLSVFLGMTSLPLSLHATALAAEHWPNWRGPNSDGVASGKNYPVKWSGTENIRWKVALPGKGSSTPVVWGEQIFLTYGLDGDNLVAAYDRQGNAKWQTKVGKERGGKHKKATGSNPSPATDGKQVYVYFKSGDLAALDMTGKLLWQHNLQDQFGQDTLWWDLGTSPVVTEKAVVVAVMQTGPSYLVAYDKVTGKQLWKQDRNLDAPSEAAQSYSTPVVVRDGSQETLVVLGADHVTAHDAETGKETWRVGGLNPTRHQYFRSIASAVVADGVVIAPYARGASITAIGLKGDKAGKVLWSLDKLGADVPTPIAKGGRVYVCTDKGKLACLDIQTGKEIWTGDVKPNRNAFSASPILADGKIYMTREDGTVFVAGQGDKFEVLAENSLGNSGDADFTVATPVFVDGQILLRTLDHLYCIAGTK
jgi:outer membrane protein assembly factor BamB